MRLGRKLLALFCVFVLCSYLKAQTFGPDLSKKDDLKALGIGLIVKKDGGNIRKIYLNEVNITSIVYMKENNLHDFEMDKIEWIEFPESKWGPLKIKFEEGKPKLYKLSVY